MLSHLKVVSALVRSHPRKSALVSSFAALTLIAAGTGVAFAEGSIPSTVPRPPVVSKPATSALCNNDAINREPGILTGYSPSAGQAVGKGGFIKVWVSDEHPPFIAPGELVNGTTGAVTKAGDRTAKAPDGYLWSPALYLGKSAAAGGTPLFPVVMKGDLNNNPPSRATAAKMIGTIDPPPPGTKMDHEFNSEYIWSVDAMKLAPGTYSGEFLIYDGDRDRGVGCINITIGGTVTPTKAPAPVPVAKPVVKPLPTTTTTMKATG